MVPLPLLLSLFGREDNTHSTNANSSPTPLAHTVCPALKAHTSLDQPFLAGPAGSKDRKGDGSNNNGNPGSSSQELGHAPDWDGPPFPSLATVWQQQGWWASEGSGNKEGNGNCVKGGKQQQEWWQQW
jgi:hypothetical protein